MPLAEIVFSSVISSFFTSAAVTYGKDIVERIYHLDCCTRIVVNSPLAPDMDESIDNDDNVVIPHDVVTDKIISIIEGHRGGITVIGAPMASGKSTYIGVAVKHVKANNPQAIIKTMDNGTSMLVSNGLHGAFGIQPPKALSTFLPKGTVLIIDQADMLPSRFDDIMQEYIVQIATNSRNSKKYTVILCVSNPEVYAILLGLNGRDKIKPLFSDPENMKWNSIQMMQYIAASLPHWTVADRERLMDLCSPAGSPGVLWNAVTTVRQFAQFEKVNDADIREIRREVEHKVAMWSSFNNA